MQTVSQSRNQRRQRRHTRVRAKISGTAECPRLSVFRSLTGMYVQLIDDAERKTLCSVRGMNSLAGDAGERTGKIAQAYLLGKMIAEKAGALNITHVVFDRSGYQYHGRIQAVADGARDGGLQF